MAWRGLHISQPARLSLEQGRIRVRQGEDADGDPLSFPLEDVAWVILDDGRSTLSARLIAACMEAGTPLVFCDQRHLPCGVALPFHQHYAQTQVGRAQLALSAPLKKRLWQAIVKAKIYGQALNLRYAQHADHQTLKTIATHVRSGDPDNVEARAARYYWPRLFDGFTRSDDEDLRNALLNYAYACVRAAIARALVASGFIPSIGIHHDGGLNPFNLADDLIEPYRPIADWAVAEHLGTRHDEGKMTLADRRTMAAVLTREIVIAGEQMSLLHAVERSVESLRRAVEANDPTALVLPEGW